MILIVSSPNDNGVIEVAEWLRFYEVHSIWITGDVPVQFLFTSKGLQISIDKSSYIPITTGWIRNPFINLIGKEAVEKHVEPIKKWLFIDMQKSLEFFLTHLKSDYNFLGTPYTNDINKLSTYLLAKKVGLNVPEFIYTGRRDDVAKFLVQKGEIITKSAGWNINFSISGQPYFAYTTEITQRELNEIPELFMHSLFQKKISTNNEVRIVYLDGQIYSMLQVRNNVANVDIRKTNEDCNYFPYSIPPTEKHKIDNLCKLLRLDFCVFDFLEKDSMLYLIDINPTGQFTNVSKICNHQIEKKIADILLQRYELRTRISK